MTNCSDNVEKSSIDVHIPVKETQWESLAASAWTGNALADTPGNTKLTGKAEGILSVTLSEAQKQEALKIEKDILSGNLPALKIDMRNHAGHAQDFTPVMQRVAEDLKARGITAHYSQGSTKWGNETSFHNEGQLELCDKKGMKELEISTDPRIGVSASNLRVLKDGSNVSEMTISFDDPTAVLHSIVGIKDSIAIPHAHPGKLVLVKSPPPHL